MSVPDKATTLTLPTDWTVVTGDCVDLLARLPDGCVNLACTDPVYNIGVNYDTYSDDLPASEYLDWCGTWMREVHRVLEKHGSFWIVINNEWVSELDVLAKKIGFYARGKICWFYTFGVACSKNFSRSHANLLYFTKSKTKFTFNAKDPAVRVPSSRQLVYNDSRANPDGKLPDDTWILHPKDLELAFAEDQDTWHVNRVCGTFKERVDGAPNQLPIKLLDRIILSTSNPGDLVLDPFSGTGTTGASAISQGRRYLGFELSETYAARSRDRLGGIRKAADCDVCDGPGRGLV